MKFLMLVLFMFASPTLASEQGRQIYTKSCSGCHGDNGVSSNDYIPNLVCQKTGYLKKQVYNFKSWKRAHSVMREQVKDLSEKQIDQLISFIADIPCTEELFDLKSACTTANKDRQSCLACCLDLENIDQINSCTKTCDSQLRWKVDPGKPFNIKK